MQNGDWYTINTGHQSNGGITNLLQGRKCLRKEIGHETFDNYFQMISHLKGTRNNNISIKLPKIKSEVPKQGFYFGGAKLFYGLPLTMRTSLKLN